MIDKWYQSLEGDVQGWVYNFTEVTHRGVFAEDVAKCFAKYLTDLGYVGEEGKKEFRVDNTPQENNSGNRCISIILKTPLK